MLSLKFLSGVLVVAFSLSSNAATLKKLKCSNSSYKIKIIVSQEKDQASLVQWTATPKSKNSDEKKQIFAGYLWTGEAKDLSEFYSSDMGSSLEVKSKSAKITLNEGYESQSVQELKCK